MTNKFNKEDFDLKEITPTETKIFEMCRDTFGRLFISLYEAKVNAASIIAAAGQGYGSALYGISKLYGLPVDLLVETMVINMKAAAELSTTEDTSLKVKLDG